MKIALATTLSRQGSTTIGRVIPLAQQLASQHQVHVLWPDANDSRPAIRFHHVGAEPFIRTAGAKRRLASIPLALSLLRLAFSTFVALLKIKPDLVIIVKTHPHNVLGVYLWSLFNSRPIILDVDDFELTANQITSFAQRAAIHWAEHAGFRLARQIVT